MLANRNRILHLLRSHPKFISSEQLYLNMRNSGIQISYSTVYQHLRQLKRERVLLVRKQKRALEYKLNKKGHDLPIS
ncbi:MAG: transcriptional repressor [Saprospiraceae bacterium]|nr:transcriptional repressor [Saprospiraceae bacterium]